MCENGLLMSMLSKVIVITVCECMHLIRRGHFRSCDKDGGHTIGSAVSENPMLHAKLMALSFIEPELWATEVYSTRIGIFFTFFCFCYLDHDPITCSTVVLQCYRRQAIPMEQAKIRPSVTLYSLHRSLPNLVQLITSATHTHMQILVKFGLAGNSPQIGEI